MKRIQCSLATRILVFTMGLALVGVASAADASRADARVRAESRVPADAPLLGRIVITPTPKQLARAGLEKRNARLYGSTAAVQRANIEHSKRAL